MNESARGMRLDDMLEKDECAVNNDDDGGDLLEEMDVDGDSGGG